MKNRVIGVACMAITFLLANVASSQTKNVFTHRYITLDVDMLDRGTHNAELFPAVSRAAKSGYNGIMLGGQFFDMDKNERKNKGVAQIRKLVAHGRSLGLEMIPWSLTGKDPSRRDNSLVEAIPVIGTPLVVNGGEAVVDQDPSLKIKNGGFEEISGVVPANWKSVGSLPALDKQIVRSGNTAIRYENPAHRTSISQTMTGLKPFRAYELAVWVKTVNFSRFREVSFLVMNGGNWLLNRRDHGFVAWTLNKNQGWTRYTIDFNTTHATSVSIVLRPVKKGKATGTVWFDDVEFREVGLYETVRRESLPVVVRSRDGVVTYKEGVDYIVKNSPLECSNCAKNQGLTIPSGSRIKNGQKLTVDWAQHGNMETTLAPASLCSDRAWNTVADIVRAVDEVFGDPSAQASRSKARGWNLYIDEWRVANWDPACSAVYKTAGDYLGEVAVRSENLIRQSHPHRHIYLCGDMYDPYHNSLPQYGLTNGGTYGSWKPLLDSTILWTWLHPDGGGAKSARFWGGLDPKYEDVFQKQMVGAMIGKGGNAGLSMATSWENVLTELEKEGLEGVVGWTTVHYAPDYTDIEPVAEYFKETGRWGDGPIPEPSKITSIKGKEGVSGSPAFARFGNCAGDVSYSLTRKADVRISVFDVAGREIFGKTIDDQRAGSHQVDLGNAGIAAGVYAVRLDIGGNDGFVQTIVKKAFVF